MSSNRQLQVDTIEGPVAGAMDGNIFVFKGIPYAEPPIGQLRWKPPVRIEKWPEPIPGLKRGPSCFQNVEMCTAIGGGDPEPVSEDCLYLNVWTPQLQGTAEPLPVMVWIHGGGFVIGAGGLPPYVGTPLAKRDVVVVNINYRLGHLGFFAHPALDAEYPEGEAINNFALLDQIAALEWVQRNIAFFGGDPGNVTIFGQSAGGRSVLSLFACPLAEGLFHKGIAQSVYGLPDLSRPDALQRGREFAAYFKVNQAEDVAAELRKLNAEEFLEIDPRSLAAFGPPVAISGDSVLREPMLDVFDSGDQNKSPLIIGNTSDDSSVLADFGLGPLDIIQALRDARLYAVVKPLYPPATISDEELGRQVGRDLLFSTMSYFIAQKHYEVRDAGATSWRYYFDYVAEKIRRERKVCNGAAHGDEIVYVMDTGSITPPIDKYFSDEDRAFAQKVSDYWLAFAHMAPNAVSIPGAIAWPKHVPSPNPVFPNINPSQTMRLGENFGDTIKLEPNFMRERVSAFLQTMRNLGEMLPKQIGVHSYQEVEPQQKKKSA